MGIIPSRQANCAPADFNVGRGIVPRDLLQKLIRCVEHDLVKVIGKTSTYYQFITIR